ncbi:hypothetical protein BGZ46_005340, partial [Entomortierella lignicola]
AQGYNDPINLLEYRDRCCEHRSKASESVDIDQLPDFIVDDVNFAKNYYVDSANIKRYQYHSQSDSESE